MICGGFDTSNNTTPRKPRAEIPTGCSRLLLLLLMLALTSNRIEASNIESEFVLEEISVVLDVKGIGKYYVNAVYATDSLYLSVTEVFELLRINQQISFSYDTISGFFVNEEFQYLINYPEEQVMANNRFFSATKEDLIKTETGLYMGLDLFGKVFGLHCIFNERNMAVVMKTDLELPAIKEMKQAAMRKNINQLSGRYTVDTTLDREFHYFNRGMIDWMVSSSQATDTDPLLQARIGIGRELLFGETNVFINYNSDTEFDFSKQQYIWRYVDNDLTPFRQIQVGSISNNAVSTIREPVLGMMVTNTPTTYRRSYGTFVFSDFIEPDWTVELYVNNVLVDYASTDASGFYRFDIPIVYGYSDVKLKFFGPYGEEKIDEQRIHIPYNFLPEGELEYTLRSGMVMDSLHSIFTRAEANYGINRWITAGTGVEYLSSLQEMRVIPFIYTSATLFKGILLNAEYAMNVRAKSELSYRTKKNLSFRLQMQKMDPNQTAVRYNANDEVKLNVNSPYKIFRSRGSFSFGYGVRGAGPGSWDNLSQLTVASRFGRINANLNTIFKWRLHTEPGLTTNLGLNYRVGRRFSLRTQTMFDVMQKEALSLVVSAERRFKNDFNLMLSYQNYFPSREQGITFSLQYSFPFAQTSASVRLSKAGVQSSQTASGSLMSDWQNNRNFADTRTAVGRGAITVVPFLDVNHNGRKDSCEHLVADMEVITQGGRILPSRNDSLIRITGLELYTSHLLEFRESGFESITWMVKDKKVSVYPDPNQFKQVMVPVVPMGEAFGMVYVKRNNTDAGQGQISVCFYDETGRQIHKTLSESDGYFSHLGFPPGKYYAQLDTMQLRRINMTAEADSLPFEIRSREEGDLVSNLIFTLLPVAPPAPEPPAEPDSLSNQPTPFEEPVPPVIETPVLETPVLEGYITARGTSDPVAARLEIIDTDSGKVILTAIADPDSGHYRITLPERKDYGVEVLAEGHMFFIDYIRLNDMPMEKTYRQDFVLDKLDIGNSIILSNILFETGKATLQGGSYQQLQKLKRLLDENPTLRIELSGHTDNIGSYKSNIILSEDRAKAVADYLISLGVDRARLTYRGYGPDSPIATNKTVHGRQMNRRVEFKVISD